MEIIFKPETHEYFVNGVKFPSVTQIITKLGLSGNTEWFTEEGRTRGRHVHLACHYLDENDLDMDSFSKDYWGYLDAYKLFLDEVKPLWHFIERFVACPDYKYAGTFDRMGSMLSTSCVVDIKTGQPHPSIGLQLAAYKSAWERQAKQKRYGLFLSKDGMYKIVAYDDNNDIKIFRAAVALWYWKNNNKLISEA
jgi:hypothetical protein